MARPGGAPENMRPQPWQPGQSGNPSGVTKAAATLRSLSQTMWGLYYTDDAAYQEMAAKYPRIAEQVEARAKQAMEGNTAAINRVDTETVGPLKQSLDIGTIKKIPTEQLEALLNASAEEGE